MKRSIAVCLGLLALTAPAAANLAGCGGRGRQGQGHRRQFMDYVTAKTVIKIADSGSIRARYLKSCRRETISGAGTVVVGNEESVVDPRRPQGGEERTAIPTRPTPTRQTPAASPPPCCAAPHHYATGAAAHALRRLAVRAGQGRGTLVVRRLNLAGRASTIALGGTQLKGKFVDFAGKNVAWSPAAYTPPRSNRRKSCSGSTPRPSPARRRSSAGCCGWNRRAGPFIFRHGRACPGHPRLACSQTEKTWMPGTSPGMTRKMPMPDFISRF